MGKTIIKGLFDYTQKLERFTILEVPPQTISEIEDVVAAAAKMSVNIEWVEKILGEIAA